jgi:hypothetical protein
MSDEPHLGGGIAYVNGDLHVEDVALKALAVERAANPVDVCSLAMMNRRYREFETAMEGD